MNGQYHKMEFWDSKLSGKKKFALDSRIIYFKQFDDDVFFVFKFMIGFNTITINQIGEDAFDVRFDGRRFKDLVAQERRGTLQKKERENRIYAEQKKIQDEYYNRALTYNGKDYYEGKEKALLYNNNNNNMNNDKKPIKYDYNYYKQHKNDKYYNYKNNNININNNYNSNQNNNNIYHHYNNNNNNININNNNYNYNNNNQILNDNDIRQIKNNVNKKRNNNNYNNNINQNKINNNDNNNKNIYPSFSTYNNTENNVGYNNNKNNNNNNKNDMNLMNELTAVFAKQRIQDNNNVNNDLPTLSQINNANNVNKNNENDELINYIGNLNKNVPMDTGKESTPVHLNKVDIKPKNTDIPLKETVEESQIQLNIYDNNENLNNIKKVYVNNSTFNIPQNQDYYEDENPYNDY